jgi:protein-tyrosine phosphatase
MQVNASFFITLFSRHKALSLIKEEKIQFIGSDCHNITSRPPQIGKAFEIIQKKLGDDYISQMNEYGYSMLEK